MQGKRFREEFKLEAVKQITERQVPVQEVSRRLGVSTWSLYQWVKHYAVPPEQRKEQDDQAAKIRRLESELRRVTEERDILKKAAAYFAKQSG
jgi:transposase